MINEGIQQGKYEVINDTNLEDFKKFDIFLYRNFNIYPSYNDMKSASDEPERFFATTKIHTVDNFYLINVNDLKLRPITDQSNTFTYKATKIVSNYLQPLARKEYVIEDSFSFSKMIKNDTLVPDKEYVFYDVESLFAKTPVIEIIVYHQRNLREQSH